MTKTTITNVSSKTLHLSWVPPHGKTLAPTESVKIPGNIVWYLVTFGRINQRKYAAMQSCVSRGLVTVAVGEE